MLKERVRELEGKLKNFENIADFKSYIAGVLSSANISRKWRIFYKKNELAYQKVFEFNAIQIIIYYKKDDTISHGSINFHQEKDEEGFLMDCMVIDAEYCLQIEKLYTELSVELLDISGIN